MMSLARAVTVRVANMDLPKDVRRLKLDVRASADAAVASRPMPGTGNDDEFAARRIPFSATEAHHRS